YPWVSATWKGGQPRKAEWVDPAMVAPYEWKTTLSFTNIRAKLDDAINQFLSFKVRSSVMCRYSKSVDSLQAFACNCFGSLDCNLAESESTSAISEVVGGVEVS